MSCPRITPADGHKYGKYMSRPSPPYPANDPRCHGKIVLGNDGNLWISKLAGASNRWVKYKGYVPETEKPAAKKPAAKKPN